MGGRFRRFDPFDLWLPGILLGCIVLPLAYGLNERYLWWDYRREATLEEMRAHAKDWAEFEAARLMLDRLSGEFACASSVCWNEIVNTLAARSEKRPMTSGVAFLAGGFAGEFALVSYGSSCEDYALAALVQQEAREKFLRELAAGERAMQLRQTEEDRRILRSWETGRQRAEGIAYPLAPSQRVERQPPGFGGGGELTDSGYWQRRMREGY